MARSILLSTPDTPPRTGTEQTREREKATGTDPRPRTTPHHPHSSTQNDPQRQRQHRHTFTSEIHSLLTTRPHITWAGCHEHITLDPPTFLTVDTCSFQTRASTCTSDPCPDLGLYLWFRGACARFARF